MAENEKKYLDQEGTADLIGRINSTFVTKEEFNYKPIAINSFTNNKNTVELGTTITEVVLNWALNKKAKILTLDGKDVPLTDTTKTLSGQSITANKAWSLRATDEKDAVAAKATSVTFLNGVYWGAASVPGALNSAFILTLTKALQGSKGKTFTVNAGAGQYIFYAVPTRFGAVTFNVGGFDGGFVKTSSIEFTNASGYKESYDIYKSVNPNLGNTTVTAK